MNAAVTLTRATEERQFDYVERLLTRNDLPATDVRSTPARFYVGFVDGDRIGVGGIEQYGPDGLLRSVVVEESKRGRGLGTALCDAIERRASALGVDTLYLLTTTATAFFAGRGYVVVERDDVPDTIRGTTEFADLCPATATCLRTSLETTTQ